MDTTCIFILCFVALTEYEEKLWQQALFEEQRNEWAGFKFTGTLRNGTVVCVKKFVVDLTLIEPSYEICWNEFV